MAVYLGSNKVGITIPGSKSGDSTEVSDAVRFIDYDGTILYKYTKSEFLALSAMPSNPSHTGLVAQGWNWSLSDAQDYVEDWDFLDIGQMYVTQSGDTEIDIYFPSDCARLSPYLGIAINGEVDVDWGDNSAHSTITGTSLSTQIRTLHEYSSPGNYTIKIRVNSGKFVFLSTTTYFVLSGNFSSANNNKVYANAIKNVRIGNNCDFSSYSFYYCQSLRSITIPNSVTSLGNNNTFSYCYSLKSITIPSGVTELKQGYFQSCCSLQSITIPNSVTGIYDGIFSSCDALRSLIIPDTLTYISTTFMGENAGIYRIVIPKYQLKYESQFRSITIPDDIDTLPAYCLKGIDTLKSIILPSSLNTLPTSIFNNCISLQSVIMPGISVIGSNSFASCFALSSITLPGNITNLSNSAFTGCHALYSITFSGSNNSVSSLGSSVFSGCYSLQSIDIPNSVTSIGNYAFQSEYSISSINLPSSLTTINTYAFSNCHCLSSIIIPSGVTTIGNYAFQNCYGMKEYHIEATTPPTLGGSSVFANIPSDCIIYVPQGTLSAYQSATNWSTHAAKMQEESA